jgi:anti-repressor protein
MNSAHHINDMAVAPHTGDPIISHGADPTKRATATVGLPARLLAGERLTRLALPVNTMNSREIADLTGKEHRNVMRDARAMLMELHGEGGVLSFEHTQVNPQNGQAYPVYRLPKRETLILVSGYSVTMRAKIIDRWQELESALTPALALPDFSDLVAAARAWADQVEAKNLLQIENGHKVAQLAVAAPKVEFADAMLNSEGTVLVRDAAKTIGAPVRKLERALRDKGVILRDNAPAAYYVTKGYFKVSTFTVRRTRGDIMSHTARVTGKGMEFLRRFALRAGLIGRIAEMNQGVLL